MKLRVNLVVIMLALSCWISAYRAEDYQPPGGRKLNRLSNVKLSVKRPVSIRRPATSVLKSSGKPILKIRKNSTNSTKASSKLPVTKTALAVGQTPEQRRRPKKNKIKLNRALMALLMAYKLKFATLIPTMVGGLILLLGTTAIAGFFFALFAAILGLKGQ